MKKTYTKPHIVFESFIISSNIAADCSIQLDSPTKGNCGYKGDFDYMIFVTREHGCVSCDPDGDGYYNGICYHTPIDTAKLFNS